MTLPNRIESAFKEAGIAVSFTTASGRVTARVERNRVESAAMVAVRTLQRAGCRTCVHRFHAGSSILGFSESGSLCIDILSRGKPRSFSLRRRKAPCVALLGPDGVGKSTVLRLVKEWFAREAPFVDVTVRQWRPGLLPPLAAFLGKADDGQGDQRPRRHKGNLQWLRLFYYFLDFLFGSWWKDRETLPGSRLVVYDRCALDMEVDPYRFALSSRRGARLLWTLTPRPAKLILLFDTPERIARRKDDLRESEMAEQLESWLKLASEDEVHAIIRVDDTPREIANRVRDLFIDALLQGNDAAVPATAEQAPGEHAVLAGRFLIPLDRRKTAAASLDIYNPQRPVAKIAKALLRAGLRVGAAQIFLRHRAGLGSLAGVQTFLSRAVACEDVAIAISLGTPGPNQKPTIQIMDRAGVILGYAKAGSSERAIASIQNERQALRTLDSAQFSTAVLPRLLDAGWVKNNYVLVQSPCASAHESRAIVPDRRHVCFLAELHGLRPSYRELPFPEDAEIEEMRDGGFHYYAHLIESAKTRWCERGAFPCGPAHGDFTPWNIRSDGGALFVFDWEAFEERTPAAWDLFHFIVAGAVEVRGTKPGAIYAQVTKEGTIRDLIGDYFRQIGASVDCIAPLFVSYAANALRASVIDLRYSASAKDTALQRTWAALLALFLYQNVAPAAAPRRNAAVVGAL
ncbi:MAG: hypothetical protein ABSH09_03835 [Bryobacteraceae bacterium]